MSSHGRLEVEPPCELFAAPGSEMTRQQELLQKLARVRSFMDREGYEALLLTSDQNFAWFGCGAADLVEHSGEMGRSFGNLLVTVDHVYLVANNIELPRLLAEEVAGLELEPVAYEWTEGGAEGAVRRLLAAEGRSGCRLAADTFIEGATNERDRISLLRTPLCENEIDRFRQLCSLSAEAMGVTMDAIRPGMSETVVASIAGRELLRRGAFPTLILVGADQRISRFRHPVPTSAAIERYCMVVICAQKWGLVSSLTRLVHFGALPEELRAKYSLLLDVEQSLIAATSPGRSLAEIYATAELAYARAGYPGEEKKHFQGGTCGYYSREQELSPAVDYRICDGEVFAHNPTITGVKVEDTIMVHRGIYEILTEIGGWPSIERTLGGATLARPGILIR